jgi:lipopolysaccharide transport system permease protein
MPGLLASRTRIERSGRLRTVNVQELWAYRSLIRTFVERHLQVRYAQSVLGVGWSIVRPLLSMIVLTIVFDKFARIPSDGVPYPVFSLAAVVPWTYFSTALTGASESLGGNGSMITKIYFPRLALPIASVLAPLVDLAIGFVILLLVLLWFGLTPAFWSILVLPLVMMIMILTATGVGCFVAAIDVQYRDASRLVPFLLQLWMYASPVVYPMSMVPEKYRAVYRLNPMADALETFRSVLLGTTAADWSALAKAISASALICAAGMLYFRNRERIFADVV